MVQLGCGDGKLTAALHANDSFIVHGLDADAAKVAAARDHIQSLGLYGKVSVEQWSGPHLPYADNLVNLVVAENLSSVPMEEVLRVLVPNGVALVRDGQTWKKTAKPRPSAMDEWTHFLHGPDNNAVAHDSLVGAPFRIQWVDGPKWARNHNNLSTTSAMVTSGGRLFVIVDEGPTASLVLPSSWQLVARDALTAWCSGKTHRPVGKCVAEVPQRADGIAAKAGRGWRSRLCHARLPEAGGRSGRGDGKEIRTYAETEGALEIVIDQGVLYVVAGIIDPKGYAESLTRGGPARAP